MLNTEHKPNNNINASMTSPTTQHMIQSLMPPVAVEIYDEYKKNGDGNSKQHTILYEPCEQQQQQKIKIVQPSLQLLPTQQHKQQQTVENVGSNECITTKISSVSCITSNDSDSTTKNCVLLDDDQITNLFLQKYINNDDSDDIVGKSEKKLTKTTIKLRNYCSDSSCCDTATTIVDQYIVSTDSWRTVNKIILNNLCEHQPDTEEDIGKIKFSIVVQCTYIRLGRLIWTLFENFHFFFSF